MLTNLDIKLWAIELSSPSHREEKVKNERFSLYEGGDQEELNNHKGHMTTPQHVSPN